MIKVFEIGVGNPDVCRCSKYLGAKDVECHLFEPHPYAYQNLCFAYNFEKNFHIYNYAIAEEEGESELCLLGDSSFIAGSSSPHSQQSDFDGMKRAKIKCKNIKEFDKGDIDILLLDMEGHEWFVIKNLISRPKRISVEMELLKEDGNGFKYKNPYYDEIMEWMKVNGYGLSHIHECDYYFTLQ
jgi:FkbM family methyltransferase